MSFLRTSCTAQGIHISKWGRLLTASMAVFASFIVLQSVWAKEIVVGQVNEHGMEIRGVYLQPVTMDPDNIMLPATKADIHLEADIHALDNNTKKSAVGAFAAGDWIPYLQIRYQLVKLNDQTAKETDERKEGHLMPMIADDGPHYGENVKLFGPGKYRLTFFIAPPPRTGSGHFGRHVDRNTGVGPWFKPFQVQYQFTFAGTGKIGGY